MELPFSCGTLQLESVQLKSEVTAAELPQADRYETNPVYRRVFTRLRSGRAAWCMPTPVSIQERTDEL
jgi:hypothetical protein